MKSGQTLQKKAVTVAAVILFIALGANTAVLTFVASGKYKTAILSKSEAIGENLQREFAKLLTLGIPIESLEGANDKIKEMIVRAPAIGYGMIVDASGKVVFHSQEAQIGKELRDAVSTKALGSAVTITQSDGSFYDIAFPLLNAENKSAGVLRIGVQSKAINTQIYTLLIWAVAISAVCFAVSIFLISAAVSRFVTGPLRMIREAADRMAAGDLTCTLAVKGDDEIADLQKSINSMAHSLKDMISKIVNMTNSVTTVTANIASASQNVLEIADQQKRAVEETALAQESMDASISQISGSVERLSESATGTSSSVFEMTVSIGKIAENANIFSETSNETASSIEEMVSTIKQIAQSLENLSASSDAISSSIEEVNATTRQIEQRANESVALTEAVMNNASDKGMTSANHALEGMENIKKTVAGLSEAINLLGKRTDDIGKIVNVIDDVADQTNLLAINAAILASKAGEHGKGFTVVADEIKSLAERTSFSTSEIAVLIKSVQDMTKSSIKVASDSIQTVEKGLVLVKDVNNALGEIVESAKVSTEMAKAIQRATTEEALAIKQITDSVEGMTEQTENISRAIQEQSRGSKFIVEATERVKNIAQQVSNATSEQKDGSRQIASIIENVSGQTMEIASAIGRQKEKSGQIVASAEKIRGTTGKLIHSANEMNNVISALRAEAMNLLNELKQFKV